MPQPADLPKGLQDFPFRHAVKVDALEDFDDHVKRLIRSLDRLLDNQSVSAKPEVQSTNTTGQQSLKGTDLRQHVEVKRRVEGPSFSDVSGRVSSPASCCNCVASSQREMTTDAAGGNIEHEEEAKGKSKASHSTSYWITTFIAGLVFITIFVFFLILLMVR